MFLVTDVQVDCKGLVVHDCKVASSECGTLFRVMLTKIGLSFPWHHYGTQPDSDTSGFRVVMLTMQWCTAKMLTGQLPRWFLAYCASILHMFAVDSTTLQSTVYTFQDATYEDALTMYDEPVIWASTECGALPDIREAELDAATSKHQWTCSPQATNRRPSHPMVGNNDLGSLNCPGVGWGGGLRNEGHSRGEKKGELLPPNCTQRTTHEIFE